MHGDFGSVVAAGKTCGQRGDGLNGAIRFVRLIAEDGDRGLYFTQHVHELAVARERHVTRPGAWAESCGEGVIGLRGCGACWSQRAFGDVELVDQDVVEA